MHSECRQGELAEQTKEAADAVQQQQGLKLVNEQLMKALEGAKKGGKR
jgi:hypothetical protein